MPSARPSTSLASTLLSGWFRYIDEAKGLCYSLQLFPDSEAILRHWQVSDPNIAEVMKYCEIRSMEVYGNPSEEVRNGILGSVREAAVSFTPELVGFYHSYRHVDVLNRAGLDACVLHAGRGFRCTWFENATPVRSMGDVPKCDLDVLVIPETYGPRSAERIRLKVNSVLGVKRPVTHDVSGIRKLVFNQSDYYPFNRYPADRTDRTSPYTHPEVEGAMVVSEDTRAYLSMAFPKLTVHRVRPSIRTDLFRDSEEPKRQIAYMPLKNPKEVAQVLHLLRFMGALDGWTLAPIQGAAEREVARIFRELAFFLARSTVAGATARHRAATR